MKKLFIAMATAMALAGTLALTACSKNTSVGENKFDDLTTAKAVYGFSAASAGMIISDMNEAAPEQTTPEQTTPEQTTPEQTAPEQTTPEQTTPEQGTEAAGNYELDGYMTLVESLLSDGGFKIESRTSDRAEYTEMVVVTYRDMQNAQNSYTMYYNQILTEAEVDEDETEETYDITGIMLIDGAEYPIRGEREVETEGRESEVETEFRVDISETEYILVEQSEEVDGGETEQEFSYSIYENRRLRERCTFEYEEEQGETELKMTCLKDGAAQTLKFERVQRRGREVIRLKTGDGRQTRAYIVEKKTDANGNAYYEYTPETDD